MTAETEMPTLVEGGTVGDLGVPNVVGFFASSIHAKVMEKFGTNGIGTLAMNGVLDQASATSAASALHNQLFGDLDLTPGLTSTIGQIAELSQVNIAPGLISMLGQIDPDILDQASATSHDESPHGANPPNHAGSDPTADKRRQKQSEVAASESQQQAAMLINKIRAHGPLGRVVTESIDNASAMRAHRVRFARLVMFVTFAFAAYVVLHAEDVWILNLAAWELWLALCTAATVIDQSWRTSPR